MRFAVAKQEGLTEERAALIDDGDEMADGLSDAHKSVLALTDVMLAGGTPTADLVAELRRHHSEAELVEIGLGISLFHGVSKALIVLGMEPDEMDLTVAPTPDVRR